MQNTSFAAASLTCLLFQLQTRADWQVVTTNEVSGRVLPSANLVIRKFGAETYREDNLPGSSRLVFAKNGEQITLNHFQKTFVRQPLPAESDQSGTLHAFPHPAEKGVIAGIPTEAYRWTNETARG